MSTATGVCGGRPAGPIFAGSGLLVYIQLDKHNTPDDKNALPEGATVGSFFPGKFVDRHEAAGIRTVIVFIAVFAVSTGALEALRRNAYHLGLVAYPGAHRRHARPTPLVGGLGIFAGVLLGMWLLPIAPEMQDAMFYSGTVLVVMGVWDDATEACFAIRFAAQALAVGLLAWTADVSLRDLGYVFDTEYPAMLGRWGVALTIFAAVGVINAVNMSDGLDGLAGALSLVTCVSLIAVSYLAGNAAYVPFLGVVVSALLAFMLYNARISGFRAARLYLGDAGSLLVGFILAWTLVAMTQGQEKVMAPVTALWVFALPLFDTVAALLRRPMRGRSPFHADRSHYHHYLREYGCSVNQTLLISVAAAAVFAGIGITAELRGVPEQLMFYAFLGVFTLYLLIMLYLDSYIGKLEDARQQSA